MANKYDGSDIGADKWIFWSVFVVLTAFVAYGLYIGNVFETYHNASTL